MVAILMCAMEYVCIEIFSCLKRSEARRCFCVRNNFIKIKKYTKKYSVGLIYIIKLRNIYNTCTYIPRYIQLNTYTYMLIKKYKQCKKLRFYKRKHYIKEKKYVQYDECKSIGYTMEEVQLI